MNVRDEYEIKALKGDFKSYTKLIALKVDTQKRLKKVRREISEIEKRKTSRKRARDKDGNLIDLDALLAERVESEKKILVKLQERTNEIERIFAEIIPYLTPLEIMIMSKLYIEGLSWKEVIELLQDNPEYSQFCYERTTYMRAHKSALRKILSLERGEKIE